MLFWDENEEAMTYLIEVFRYAGDNKIEQGFLNNFVVASISKFGKAKPVCTIAVERNKFYHSINDLPCGDYIVCLKVENKLGEVCEESAPYCFHIEDSEKKAEERADGIAAASRHRGGSLPSC